MLIGKGDSKLKCKTNQRGKKYTLNLACYMDLRRPFILFKFPL